MAARNLDRKFHDLNEAPHIYEGRIEDVNDIITALIREDRLRVRHTSVAGGEVAFLLEPYSLLVYKKGLYLAGHSHHHDAVRTFALDGFAEVNWLRGEIFEYPAGFHPAELAEGAFGLIRGDQVEVRVFFDDDVARFVRRRRWHPTQRIRAVDGGIELTMQVRGTVELMSWILGFGDKAEVRAPESLRRDLRAELVRTLARYPAEPAADSP